MSARKPRPVRSNLPRRQEEADVCDLRADFSDPESQQLLTAKARSLARELGRQCYRELRNGTDR